MSAIPICPIHASPMKLGKGGSYFCARKMPDQSWCASKAPNPDAVPAAPVANGTAPSASPTMLLVLGALEFASHVYQGTGQADDAVMLANQVFAGWRDSV